MTVLTVRCARCPVQTHNAAVVTEALSLVSRANAAAMRATVEALSHLTATMGMQLLCLGTPEIQTGEVQ